MPNNFFSVDSRFPNIADKSQDEINHELINYLHLLMEQLRYTMGNLGAGNFNETALGEIATGISEPIYRRIEDAEGNITQVQATAEGLTSRVESAEGDISVLTQTSDGLVSRVESAEGNISALTQTANGLSSRVTSAEGSISTLNQTASSLTTRVSSVEGNVSTLSQTADSLSTRVSSAEGNITTLTQTANSLTTRVSNAEGNITTLALTANGLESRVSSAEGSISVLSQTANSISARVGQNEIAINNLGISMMGTVTYAALADSSSTTVINGGDITTYNSTDKYLFCRINAGLIEWRYDLVQYAVMSADAKGFSLVAPYHNIDLKARESVVLTAETGTVNIISEYVPRYNTIYEFLHTGNAVGFIQNNAASIRAALGL